MYKSDYELHKREWSIRNCYASSKLDLSCRTKSQNKARCRKFFTAWHQPGYQISLQTPTQSIVIIILEIKLKRFPLLNLINSLSYNRAKIWNDLKEEIRNCETLASLEANTSNNQRLRSAGTTMEGQNAFAPTLCFAQVSRDRW